MQHCRHEWGLYIQADEVLHEADYGAVRAALLRAADRRDVDGLAFDYLHFFGSPYWQMTGRGAFRAEVRIVRLSSGARAFAGAQGFRVNGGLLRAIDSGARVFHYGYVKSQAALDAKMEMVKLWKGEDPGTAEPWTFYRPPGLRPFRDTHPAVAQAWIANRSWPFDPATARRDPLTVKSIRYRLSNLIERATGWRPLEHRPFQPID